MRFRYLIALIAFLVGVTGGSSWAEKVLCIHPGQPASYAHIEGADLSDISLGELHIVLSPDWISSTGNKPFKKSSPEHQSITSATSNLKEFPLRRILCKVYVQSINKHFNSYLQTVRLII